MDMWAVVSTVAEALDIRIERWRQPAPSRTTGVGVVSGLEADTCWVNKATWEIVCGGAIGAEAVVLVFPDCPGAIMGVFGRCARSWLTGYQACGVWRGGQMIHLLAKQFV
jgi:hypothetical protein